MTEREMRELLQTYGAMTIEQSKEKSVQMLELLDTSLTGTLTREEFLSKEGCMELLLAFRSIHEVDDAVSKELLTTKFECTYRVPGAVCVWNLPCAGVRTNIPGIIFRLTVALNAGFFGGAFFGLNVGFWALC